MDKQNTHNQNKIETTAKPTNIELEKPLKETIPSMALGKNKS